MRIGILALQGAFAEHKKMLENLGAECVELRQANDVIDLDGIVLPGGESTVQGKLLRELNMFDKIQKLIEQGLPTLATCAGLVLLADEIVNDDNVYFKTLPVSIKRNAYGRQLGSFDTVSDFKGIGEFDMKFIRAPYIVDAHGAEVLTEVDGHIVAVKYNNQLALSFHPELGEDNRIHKRFLQMVQKFSRQ